MVTEMEMEMWIAIELENEIGIEDEIEIGNRWRAWQHCVWEKQRWSFLGI